MCRVIVRVCLLNLAWNLVRLSLKASAFLTGLNQHERPVAEPAGMNFSRPGASGGKRCKAAGVQDAGALSGATTFRVVEMFGTLTQGSAGGQSGTDASPSWTALVTP